MEQTYKKLKEHLENTPKEQLKKEFDALKKYNSMGKTMKIFQPIINCGLNSGDSPMYWDNNFSSFHGFETYDECEDWIDLNMENFTTNEISGGIYPQEFEVENPTIIDADGIPIVVVDELTYHDVKTTMEDKKKEFDLEGVELTDEDTDWVVKQMCHGVPKENAIDRCLQTIRNCLDEGLD